MSDVWAFTHIDSWWDRKGENEIDIIAADDLGKKVCFYEVKRKKKELDLEVLKEKVACFLQATGKYAKYEVSYRGLCMDDMFTQISQITQMGLRSDEGERHSMG